MQAREEIMGAPTHSSHATTLVLSLAYKGCTDTEESREQLIEFIIEYLIQHPQYETVVVANGSDQQSVRSDCLYSLGQYADQLKAGLKPTSLSSSAIILKEFPDALAKALKKANSVKENEQPRLQRSINVKRLRLLTADVLNDLEPGTTLEHMCIKNYTTVWKHSEKNDSNWGPLHIADVKTKQGKSLSLLAAATQEAKLTSFTSGTSVSCFDALKVFSHYMRHQHIANTLQNLHQQVLFDTLHFDADDKLLNRIDEKYTMHLEFMLRGCKYQNIDWNSAPEFLPPDLSENGLTRPIFVGEGAINKNYTNDVQAIFNQFSASIRGEGEDGALQALSARCKTLLLPPPPSKAEISDARLSEIRREMALTADSKSNTNKTANEVHTANTETATIQKNGAV